MGRSGRLKSFVDEKDTTVVPKSRPTPTTSNGSAESLKRQGIENTFSKKVTKNKRQKKQIVTETKTKVKGGNKTERGAIKMVKKMKKKELDLDQNTTSTNDKTKRIKTEVKEPEATMVDLHQFQLAMASPLEAALPQAMSDIPNGFQSPTQPLLPPPDLMPDIMLPLPSLDGLLCPNPDVALPPHGEMGLLPLPSWLPAKPVSEDDLRCPKCDIVYYSKGSIKNHIQVCKYVRKVPKSEGVKPSVRPKREVVNGVVKLNEEEKNSLKILEKSCFANDPAFYEDFHAEPNVEDQVKKTFASKHYNCLQCDEVLVGIKPFARHLYAHTFIKVDEDVLPTMCSGCGKEFDDREMLMSHLKKTACPGTETSAKVLMKCQLCSLRFARKDNMRKHLRMYAALARPQTNGSVFKCNVCPQVFGGQSLSTTHKLVHAKKASKFVCPCCKKTFKSKSTFIKHKADCATASEQPKTDSNQEQEEKVFKCNQCPMTFNKKSSLTGHSRVHSNFSKSYRCHWCRAVFYSEDEHKMHVKIHDDQVAKAPVCKPCSRQFNNDHNLKLHLWHTHKMTLFDNQVYVKGLNIGMYDYLHPSPNLLVPDPNHLLPLPEHLLPPPKVEPSMDKK